MNIDLFIWAEFDYANSKHRFHGLTKKYQKMKVNILNLNYFRIKIKNYRRYIFELVIFKGIGSCSLVLCAIRLLASFCSLGG